MEFCSWQTVKNICLFPAPWETEEMHFGNRHWGRGLQVILITSEEYLTLIYYCPDSTVIGIDPHLNLQTPQRATASRLLRLALFLSAYKVLMIDLPGVAVLQAPREGRGRGSWRHIFPWVISSHLFWTVKRQLVVKSCRSIPFKCQTSTASGAHKEIFERPWREAKKTWLMFHLTSPPRWLAVPRQPCLCDVSLRAPAGSCCLTACTVCSAGSRTRETKRLKHKAAELRGGVAQSTSRPPSRRGWSAASPGAEARSHPRCGRAAPRPPGGAQRRAHTKMWLFHARLASVGKRCGKNLSGSAFPLEKSTFTPQPPVACALHAPSNLPPLSHP